MSCRDSKKFRKLELACSRSPARPEIADISCLFNGNVNLQGEKRRQAHLQSAAS